MGRRRTSRADRRSPGLPPDTRSAHLTGRLTFCTQDPVPLQKLMA